MTNHKKGTVTLDGTRRLVWVGFQSAELGTQSDPKASQIGQVQRDKLFLRKPRIRMKIERTGRCSIWIHCKGGGGETSKLFQYGTTHLKGWKVSSWMLQYTQETCQQKCKQIYLINGLSGRKAGTLSRHSIGTLGCVKPITDASSCQGGGIQFLTKLCHLVTTMKRSQFWVTNGTSSDIKWHIAFSTRSKGSVRSP